MQNRKRILGVLILAVLVLPSAFADETRKGLGIGSCVTMESIKSGGAVEVAFPLYSKGGFFIRNAVFAGGFGNETDGIFTAGDKIIVGGRGLNNTAEYGFISVAAGTFQNDSVELFASPLLLEFVGGGGFEIYTSKMSSFAVEAGGGISLIDGDISGFTHLAAVFRIYLTP